MVCSLCGQSNLRRILDKPAIPIYTNASDAERENNARYVCCLKQCLDCGHVFQPISKEIDDALEAVYLSTHAQITTPLGVGNWGKERASYQLNKLGTIERFKRKSILEIGCGDGYVLKELKHMGFQDLIGVEPSLQETKEVDGIVFVRKFITPNFKMGKKVDFIFSLGVFEHVSDVNNLMRFTKEHLNDDGELFIEVPNCRTQLELGDPAVFCHEHPHCFVKDTLYFLLANHGFEVTDDRSDNHSLAVFAKKVEPNNCAPLTVPCFEKFQSGLENNLIRAEALLTGESVIVHGACNSLHNILSWSGTKSDFLLVDNDTTKQGETFFNRQVQAIESVNLRAFDAVLIVPHFFSDVIELDYVRRGFNGRIEYVVS